MLNTVNVKFSCNSHHNDHVASLEYKQIVAMGKPVVPILIFLLEREDWIVTIALGEIMGELAPEIAEDDRGRLNQIIETWKGWWEKHKNEWSLNFPVV